MMMRCQSLLWLLHRYGSLYVAHAAFLGDQMPNWTAQRRGHPCRSSGYKFSSLALFSLDEASENRLVSSHQLVLAEASAQSTARTTDALSSQDIGIGIVLALLLAALASFLQGQSTSSFPNFVLWVRDSDGEATDTDTPADVGNASLATATTLPVSDDDDDGNAMSSKSKILFNATNWNEMSRPENYIWYSNPNLRANETPKVQKSKLANANNRLALLALVILFIPIFGAELFLSLSRQFLCETNHAWAPDYCAPIFKG
jgi:hypothetical protein